MAIYHGFIARMDQGCLVTKDSVELSPARSQAVVNHSPNGFAWGYGGSGPAQLALALLLEETSETVALGLYQSYKWEVVAKLPVFWEITSQEIKDWVDSEKGGPGI